MSDNTGQAGSGQPSSGQSSTGQAGGTVKFGDGTKTRPSRGPDGGPPSNANGFDLNRPTIVSLLYLGGIITGFSALIGVVLAHVWSGEEDEAWMASHYTYLIRTFWLGLALGLVGIVLSATIILALIGIPLLFAVGIWTLVRSVMSLMKAQKREPMPDPETFLF